MATNKVTWNMIKRYFRGIDIALMRHEVEKTVVLDGYHPVVANADTISDRVESGRINEIMPPPPYAPWTQDMIENFNEWADPDTPLEVDPDLQKQAEPFVKLSEFLTGYTGLNTDPDLALKYLARLQARKDLAPLADELVLQFSQAENESQFVSNVLEGSDPQYKEIAKTIILLWYTGAFFDQYGYPADFGTPEDNQFIDGLVWQTIQAHPMAYSTEGAQYWAKKPQLNGLSTGLGNTANRPTPRPSSQETD